MNRVEACNFVVYTFTKVTQLIRSMHFVSFRAWIAVAFRSKLRLNQEKHALIILMMFRATFFIPRHSKVLVDDERVIEKNGPDAWPVSAVIN